MTRRSLFVVLFPAFFLFNAVPCPGLVSGTVIDAFKSPVSGASVVFTSESDSTRLWSAVTDANGKYRIDIPTSVQQENDAASLPRPFLLGQNYPNPFNPSTVIPFTLSRPDRCVLVIFNIQGQKVRTLIDGSFSVGEHSARWKGLDDRNRPVSAGVYLYQLRVGGKSDTKKMLLLDGGVSENQRSVSSTNRSGKYEKIAAATYQVSITGNDIVPYKESSLILGDAGIYDFTVIRIKQYQGVTFVSIPGGTFQMGDVEGIGYGEEKPEHTVTVSGFEMSVYEITNAQYCAWLNGAFERREVTVDNGRYVKGAKGALSGQDYIDLGGAEYSYPDARCWITFSSNTFTFYVVDGHENWPVVFVTWYGSKAFALYYGLDLPTESEWEYACRGGNQYEYGTDDGTLNTSKANYKDSGIKHPTAVGGYPGNPFGLYDMSGNVSEWCHDWFDNYPSGSRINPSGSPTGASRIVRGGGWSFSAAFCRSAYRNYIKPDFILYFIGFRVVRRVAP